MNNEGQSKASDAREEAGGQERSVLHHGRSCNWHWDQYDWECDCGAIPNAADLKPKWIAENIERARSLAAQKTRAVSPEERAAARAVLDAALTPEKP